MNKTRILVAIAVAVVLALFAGVGAYRFLSESSRMAEQSRLQVEGVVVASASIPLASTIGPNQVAVVPWPRKNMPKDAFADPKMVIGRVVWRDFLTGEPIVESKLVSAGKTPGIMALRVPSGMRAFSVHVNEVVGVGGFIIPDSRVDVVVTTSLGTQHGGQFSKIVLEDIQVLAAGQVVEHRDNRPVTVNTVTLAVSPGDAEKLALAVHDGKILLVLRNFIDNAVVTTAGVDKGRLLASRHAPPAETEAKPKRGPAKKPAQAQPPPPPARLVHEVLVIKGTKKSVETFEE
jgi:pilus assembly protein CpaB